MGVGWIGERPKIRQQLQAPRDRGWLEFAGRGRYRVRGAGNQAGLGARTRSARSEPAAGAAKWNAEAAEETRSSRRDCARLRGLCVSSAFSAVRLFACGARRSGRTRILQPLPDRVPAFAGMSGFGVGRSEGNEPRKTRKARTRPERRNAPWVRVFRDFRVFRGSPSTAS
jgi:hypothetical protein